MKLAYAFLTLIVIFICCKHSESEYTRGAHGMEYKIVQRDPTGVAVHEGEYLKLSVHQRFGDTVLRDPAVTGYEYQLIDSTQMSKEGWEMFHNAQANDSIVIRVDSDSAFKNKKPAFVKSKGWLLTTVKVIGILANADSARADREREMERRNSFQ